MYVCKKSEKKRFLGSRVAVEDEWKFIMKKRVDFENSGNNWIIIFVPVGDHITIDDLFDTFKVFFENFCEFQICIFRELIFKEVIKDFIGVFMVNFRKSIWSVNFDGKFECSVWIDNFGFFLVILVEFFICEYASGKSENIRDWMRIKNVVIAYTFRWVGGIEWLQVTPK